MRVQVVAGLAALVAACSPGPGRPPAYQDAEVIPDIGPQDVFVPDAGFPDSGVPDASIALPDTGRPPEYPFTGIFSILGEPNKLYAREVEGAISLVFGDLPYSYTGSISPGGQVEARSAILLRSGCPDARITGYFERPAAAFFLDHVTCNSSGQPVQASLRGGFDADFDPRFSGIYELEARVFQDPQLCLGADPGPQLVRYGVNVLGAGNVIAVFTAHDLVPSTTLYVGRYNPTAYSFDLIEQLFTVTGPYDVAMRGQLTFGGLNDPVRLEAERDVFDPRGSCSFGITLRGQRISAF